MLNYPFSVSGYHVVLSSQTKYNTYDLDVLSAKYRAPASRRSLFYSLLAPQPPNDLSFVSLPEIHDACLFELT
jgi:hypothetical protein